MLSLADVLDLPVVRRALPEVVIGDGALGREIRWAHVVEMRDPDDLLKGGELVLTTGLGAGDDGGATSEPPRTRLTSVRASAAAMTTSRTARTRGGGRVMAVTLGIRDRAADRPRVP